MTDFEKPLTFKDVGIFNRKQAREAGVRKKLEWYDQPKMAVPKTRKRRKK